MCIDPQEVTGVVLAGGLAIRMQHQDKGLVLYQGRPLVSYAIAALAPLAGTILVNANRNLADYQQFSYPVISDQDGNFDGPLAGILAAMRVASTPYLLVVPCDSPLVQSIHLQRLLSAIISDTVDIAVANDGQRMHPVFLALKSTLADSLQSYLDQGERKIQLWLQRHRCNQLILAMCQTYFLTLIPSMN